MNYFDILEEYGITMEDSEMTKKFCTNMHNAFINYDCTAIQMSSYCSICQKIGVAFFDLDNFCIKWGEFLRYILRPLDVRVYSDKVEFKKFLGKLSIMLQDDFLLQMT